VISTAVRDLDRDRVTRVVVIWTLALFAITGVGAAPFLLSGISLSRVFSASPQWLFLLGVELTAFAPTLAAVALRLLAPTWAGPPSLRRQLRHWRVGPGWYLIASFGPTVIALVAAALESALTGAAPTTWLTLQPEVIGLVGGLVVGPLGEELGWRGFALPRLQERYGTVIASMVIGVTWAVWHNWPIVTGEPFDVGGIATSGLRLVAVSILFAFLYNATHGALLVAMCAHAGYNLANQVVYRPDADVLRGPVELAIYVVLALGVTVFLARRQPASSNKQIPPFP
jgi:uncharacterized protein